MKTDFEKGMELRNMVKKYIPFDIVHKLLSNDDSVTSDDDINKNRVSFYISTDYVSLVINDCDRYIKYEICLTDRGIDLKTLKRGNFKDMATPDFDYLYGFIEGILKGNKNNLKNEVIGKKGDLIKQIDDINLRLKYIEKME